jgi:hypothetical protein
MQVWILKETPETGTGKIQRRKVADSMLVKDEPKVKPENTQRIPSYISIE